MTPEQHIIYLYSALFFICGLFFIIYFWLKDVINFKVKATFIKGGVGRLFIDKVGNVSAKYQTRQKEDGTLKIGNKGYLIDPAVRVFRFLGIPTAVFIEDIPKNIDILQGEDAYTQIRTQDIDTHIRNISEGAYIDWFKKYGTWVLLGIVFIVLAIGVNAFFGYKVYEFVQDRGAMVIENVLQPK